MELSSNSLSSYQLTTQMEGALLVCSLYTSILSNIVTVCSPVFLWVFVCALSNIVCVFCVCNCV